MEKGDILDYVIISDVSDKVQPYYYCGYFEKNVPVHTQDYTQALKLAYEDEAEILCEKLNVALKDIKIGFHYHVEEHKYFQ